MNDKSKYQKYFYLLLAVFSLICAFFIGKKYSEDFLSTQNKNTQIETDIYHSTFSSGNENVNESIHNNNVSKKYITEEEALEIALKKIGLNEDDLQFLHIHLENNEGFFQYEVDFISGENEYDFEINASDGRIIEFDFNSIYD